MKLSASCNRNRRESGPLWNWTIDDEVRNQRYNEPLIVMCEFWSVRLSQPVTNLWSHNEVIPPPIKHLRLSFLKVTDQSKWITSYYTDNDFYMTLIIWPMDACDWANILVAFLNGFDWNLLVWSFFNLFLVVGIDSGNVIPKGTARELGHSTECSTPWVELEPNQTVSYFSIVGRIIQLRLLSDEDS